MWKALLVLVFVANTLFTTTAAGSSNSKAFASSSSRVYSSSSDRSSCGNNGRHPSHHGHSGGRDDDCSDDKPTKPPHSQKCPKNEVFDSCPVLCPPRECGVNPAVILCAVPPKPGDPECEPGCRCRDGYLRDYNGICIPENKCPNCTGLHEVWDPCPPSCPPQTCESIYTKYDCPEQPIPGSEDCEGSCRCEPGYFRNKIGQCISTDDCQPPCGANEILSDCPSNECRPLHCSEVGYPVACPASNSNCSETPVCICDYGFVRNDVGACIPIEDCPSCGGDPNAVSGCGVNCGRLCSNYKSKDVACILVCYENACDCREGYVLDENTGKCVLPKDCTKCPPNEVYDECPAPCPPRRCGVDERLIRCAAPPQPGDPECEPGCRCVDGYVRNDQDVCVTKDQCQPPCGANEILSDCPSNECRPLHCSEVGYPVACPASDSNCPGRPVCICDYGYVKNDAGVCIPIEDCPSCAGDPNAVSGCGINCGRLCSNYKSKDVACIQVCYENACDCREEYVLDDKTGKCVLPEDCSPVCGVNEVYSNCTNGGCGPKECSSLGYNIGCVKMDQKYCKEGCICKGGYLRDDKGKCIPKSKCPECGGDPNAVSGCGINCGRHCSNYDKGPVSCIAICYEDGCDCKKGYVVDDNTGQCVLPEDCTPQCGENEKFDECPDTLCTPQNCSQLGFPLPAVPCPRSSDDPCPDPPACVCIDGYVRNDQGRCIPKEDCPSCGGDPNAVSGCGVNCGRLCSNYDQDEVSCIEICYLNACDCRDGYVLDENTDKCVRPEDCTPQCGNNERFEQCPATLCTPQKCSQLGFPLSPCPPQSEDPCPGSPGCVCIDDYVRNDQGNCIPKTDCPSCGGDPNAVSGCGVNCGKLCTNYDQGPVPCPRICYPNACDCRDGYVLDENTKMCVFPEDCTPACDVNERWDTCGNGGCRRWNCSEPILCIDPLECESRCVCLNDYARADNGTCIPEKECPPDCGVNERWDTCGNGGCRRWNCSQPTLCIDPLECEGRCVCLNDYARADNGTCIPENECDQCNKAHEYWDSCASTCPPETCKSIGRYYRCPPQPLYCRGACRCEEGYCRNKNGDCIPKMDDTLRCADDERYEECPDNLCEPQSCSELGFPIDCPALSGDSNTKCPGGPRCICDNNNVRDEDGNCIPKEQCPSCGGDPNAVTGCGINCGRHCSNYKDKNVVCPLICKLNGCNCKDGYVYDDNLMKCVRPEDCTETCGENEEYDSCANGGCRRRSCSERETCILPIECEGGCVCRGNYTRAANGTCIPQDQCPEQCNNPNEYYDECPSNCPPQTCESIGKMTHCPMLPTVCKGTCRCNEGFYRNKIGDCISEEDCKKCPGPHEYYSCGGPCDNVCAIINKQNQTNCPIVNIKCNKMCYCEEGYARDEKNTCIPIDQCPEPQCRDNERYEECPDNLCAPLSCSQLGFPIDCDYDSPCSGEPGCICDYGNVRDDYGNCIPQLQCPSCGGDPNATSGCGNHCGNRCSDYKKKDVMCPMTCMLNGCDCKEGFVYDDNLNKCVRPEDCTPPCSINEVYDGCANGGCRRRYCSQGIICVRPIKCEGGCICQQGYTRDKNGKCIKEEDCPGECNKPHEYYDDCAPRCPPQTCESLRKEYSCPVQPAVCRGACRCEKGYYRNKIGQCIFEEDCKKCTGPHEYFSCGVACDNVCASMHEQNQTNCPIINKTCNPMCYCEEGYARDDNNICIPIEDCPDSPCRPNERLEDNPDALCRPQTCSELGFPISCPTIDDDSGEDGSDSSGDPICVCDYGYVRDDDGNCIPEKECPSCGGDPNAVAGCGINCGRLCSNYDQGPVNCPKICKVNACDCRKDYVYDENISKCVLPEDCTPTCGDNEVYSECINVGCHAQNCSQLGHVVPCKKIYHKDCIKGCVCQENYLRAENGICVPEDQCPPQCNQPNEYYEECTWDCPPQTCESIGKKYFCPKRPTVCKGACRCKKGYFRNKIGECITEKECLKCMGDHEYFSCGGACDNVCATLHKQNQTNCPIYTYACNRMCYCEEGYARDDDNICIPIDQCPEPQCPDGQIYVECPEARCSPRTCSEVGFPVACPDQLPDGSCLGKPDCICEDENVKDYDGNCIPMNQCPSCGGDPNAVSGCGNHCGNRCSDYNKKDIVCTKECYYNACDCKKGFVFDDTQNICVRPEDCCE